MFLRRAISVTVSFSLVLVAPGLEAYAAAGKSLAMPLTTSLIRGVSSVPAPVTALSLVILDPAPNGTIPPLLTALAVKPVALVATTPQPGVAPATPIVAAKPQALHAAGLGLGSAAAFDGGESPSVPVAAVANDRTAAPSDLRLAPADDEAVSQFTADFHAKVSRDFASYEFSKRDYYAWVKFLRFYAPSLGIKEAVREGARYIYGDRLENEAERSRFDAALATDSKGLKLASPLQGKDDALAAELIKLAEPAAETFAADEESPFNIPLAALIPDKERHALVMTPTTLRRVDAASHAFAMRDFALLLGPPATEKSAIPKYLAAENGVPYLAVTMHPGIGTFELVGGYRPKVVNIVDVEAARRIVRAALASADQTSDYADLLESAAKIYGGDMEDILKKLRADCDDMSPNRDAFRRLTTMAHGLEYGAASLVWQDGYLTYAIKRDIWISFEELNAAPTESQEFLNEFMRSRRLVITQKLGEPETLEPKQGGRFMLWATMNPETDPNREVLAQTLKNRWRVKYFGDLPAFEQAEIVEKVHAMPATWALALVENVHKELVRQARGRIIGDQWRDGYEINLRHLMKVAKRWRHFVDQETAEGVAPDKARQLFLLAREAYSVYGGLMRQDNEKNGVWVMLDQALKLSALGVKNAAALRVRPDRIEDLGDRIRIGDIEIKKGPGGAFVPRPNSDYLADASTYARLYEYAKALALGEPLLVMGDSAAGKTTDLEYLFFRLNYNLRYKNLDSDTAIEEIVGGYAAGKRRGQYVYREGLLPAAMEEGSGAFLDEFNLNPLVEWLNTVIDDGRLYLPERIVAGRPLLVAAGNPPDPRYPGRILLSPATRSRYTEIWAPNDDSTPRLKSLMSHWLKGGMSYALGSGFRESLKRLFRFKKKIADDPDGASGPPSLEQVFKSLKIPEEQRPALREKAARIQTVMTMVGSAVGRDHTLKWVPGDLWGYFPKTNTAIYPAEHLVTHTEEELVGIIDHEALHRETTVLDEREPLVRKYQEDPLKHFLWNGLEDPRVNSRGIHRLPGAQRYLHAHYDRYIPQGIRAEKGGEDKEVSELGDGATAFDKKALQMPHIEFIMAANYYWRHGEKPLFLNRSAEEAFDKARPDFDDIFAKYPKDADPTRAEAAAASMAALQQIDSKVLPLYEPLVKESAKKMGKRRRQGKGKGAGGAPMPSSQPNEQPKQQPEENKPGGGDTKEQEDEKKALKKIQDHARRAAEELQGQVIDAPTKEQIEQARKDARQRLQKALGQPGDSDPQPLTIEGIADVQHDQILDRQSTAYQNVYQSVAHIAGALVTHLENVFLKNSRPKDRGYYRTGKRPDLMRAMKREGEGSVRDDVMLRRSQPQKRRYTVTVLVDESHSMNFFRREATSAVVLFVDALSRLQIDVEVIGFSDKARVHKAFGTPLTAQGKDALIAELQEHLGEGNTHDADAVKLALERSLREDADERFLFVITDGQGNGPSKLADVLPQAEAARVHVIGVGIGEGMDYVRTAYKRHAVVPRIEDLPLVLRDRLVEAIARIEQGSRGGMTAGYVQGTGSPAVSTAAGALALAAARHWLWEAAALIGYPAFVAAQFALAGSPFTLAAAGYLLYVAAAGFFTYRAFGWRDGGPLPRALGMSSLTGIYPTAFMPTKMLPWWFSLIIGVSTVISLILRRQKAQSLSWQMQWRLLRLTTNKAPAHRVTELSGTAAQRLVALHKIAADAPLIDPEQTRALIPLVELLAERDEFHEVREAAVAALAAFLPNYWARAALERISEPKLYTKSARAAAAALFEQNQREQQEAEAIAKKADAERAAAADVEARARAAIAAADESTLAGRLRRAALKEALAAYLRAKTADVEALPVIEKRLVLLLGDGKADGANALGPTLRRWLWRPVPIMSGIVVGSTALIFAVVIARPQVLLPLLFLSPVITLFQLIVFGMLADHLRPWLGLLEENVEFRSWRAARALTLDATQYAWVERLLSHRPQRLEALAELAGEAKRGKALIPILRELWLTDDARTTDALVDMAERWGDLALLDVFSLQASGKTRQATSAARAATAAAKRLRAAEDEVQRLRALHEEATKAAGTLVADARTASAALAGSPALPDRLLKASLDEALAALAGASSTEEAAVAAHRLRERLQLRSATGANALSASSRVRGWALASTGSSSLALILSAALVLSSLWAAAPAAAVGIGTVAAGLTGFLLKGPVPSSSREIFHAPRSLAATPEEFRPAALALRRLTARLGLSVGDSPGAGLYEPEKANLDYGGWNAAALGAKADASAVVGLGPSWLTASRAELEGVLAHELAHLVFGDNARLLTAQRAARLALVSVVPAAAAAVFGAAWLLPAAAFLFTGFAWLATLAISRAHELRADAFAVTLAGKEAVLAFLRRLASEAPASGGTILDNHPSPAQRLDRLNRASQ
jgi:Zn-dependent protease with chaperone function/MoxR-like ATPase